MVITLAPPRLPVNSPVLAYVDTIAVYISRAKLAYNRTIFSELSDANQGRFQKCVVQPQGWADPLGWYVTLHQPTHATLAALARHRLPLSRCHIAIDVDPDHGHTLAHATVQKWHGKRQTYQYEASTYWAADASTGRNLSYYGDRASKVTGTRCGHLELRFNGRKATRRAGLDNPRTILDDIDLDALLGRQIRFLKMNHTKLGRRLDKLAQTVKWKRRRSGRVSSIRQEQERRHLRRLSRLGSTETQTARYASFDDVPVQLIQDYCPHLRTCLDPLEYPHGNAPQT